MKDRDQESAVPKTGSADANPSAEATVDPPDDQRSFNESLEFGLRSIGRLLQKRRKQD